MKTLLTFIANKQDKLLPSRYCISADLDLNYNEISSYLSNLGFKRVEELMIHEIPEKVISHERS